MRNTDLVKGQLRFATCPVNWNNNDLSNWRPITAYPGILDRMREAGYSATEYDRSFGSDPAAVRAELESRDMELTGSYQWVDFLNKGETREAYDEFKSLLQFLNDVQCPNLIVSDSLRPHRVALAGRVPADGSESLDADGYQRIAAGVRMLAQVAAEFGIQVRYHNHVGSWFEAPHEVEALLTLLDPSMVKLCFDTGHYAYGGGSAVAFMQQYTDKIGYLHLKDVDAAAVADARSRELTFLDALREIVFSPIGTGTADIPGILTRLSRNNFDGWIVVEQDTCAGDPTVAARQNLDFLKQWQAANHNVGR